ncbi:MAG: hypothetical protein ACYTFI_00765 [Planctomycetota bacterium]|jgi:hypothetical protein
MAKRQLREIRVTGERGLIDGPDPEMIGTRGYSTVRGFEFSQGYARAEDGRSRKTSAEILTSSRVRQILEWTQADGTEVLLAVCGGHIWHDSADDYTFATPVNLLQLGANTGTRASLVVTVTGGKLKNSVQAGDVFYYDADGFVDRGVVASVDSDTQITLTSYAGTATSGAFTILRTLADGDTWLVPLFDALYVADGSGPLMVLNSALDTFRAVGMMKPDAKPAAALTATGELSVGVYRWMEAFVDTDGNVGPGETTAEIDCTAASYCTITPASTPPPWATRRNIYRTFEDGARYYSIAQPIYRTFKSKSGSGPTVFTIADNVPDLVASAHVNRYMTFATSGTSYLISANTTTTVTTAADASGESATDDFSITGGYAIAAATILDHTSDAKLDTDHEAPGVITNTTRSYNEPPPSGLKLLTRIRGGARLCALEDGTQTRIWFSGRPGGTTVSKTGQAEKFGNNEPHYWPIYQDAGVREGDTVQAIIEMGQRTFAVKQHGVMRLESQVSDPRNWFWRAVMQAEGIECVSGKSVSVHDGVAWWLGREGGKLDIIRFDRVNARGFARGLGRQPWLGDVFDSMTEASLSEATGAAFKNRIYISYPHTSGTTNGRTLRFDLKQQAFDIQPWGCGVMAMRQSESILLCGDPTSLGHVFEVLGDSQDDSSDIARILETGNLGFGDIEHPVHWGEIIVEVKID